MMKIVIGINTTDRLWKNWFFWFYIKAARTITKYMGRLINNSVIICWPIRFIKSRKMKLQGYDNVPRSKVFKDKWSWSFVWRKRANSKTSVYLSILTIFSAFIYFIFYVFVFSLQKPISILFLFQMCFY